MQNNNYNDQQPEVFSKVVKAGKRTYFIDIKSTKGQDHFITLTESKKTLLNGKESFQKHKVFLYKEDFEKFKDSLIEVIDKANALNAGSNESTTFSEDFSCEDL